MHLKSTNLSMVIADETTDPYKNPASIYYHAVHNNQRWKESDPHIAKDPKWAYYYAKDVIKGRFPEAEPVIAKYPLWACYYAKQVIGARWPEAEAAISNSEWKHSYLDSFPDAIQDWTVYGWIDWLDS